MSEPTAALDGVRVIETATLFAGPLAGTFLGDLGAEVTKIEHPRQPDPARHHGPSKDGIGLWFKIIGRNKRMATLDLSVPEGQELFRRLVRGVDVVIENFRPGTLERWGLGYDGLATQNPRLILARVTGFGQTGPYARRPGFGTIAEAMSGFAALTGEPGGPPTLPPFGLADGVAALALAYGVTAALRARDRTGRGQVIDLALIEPLLMLLGPQITAFDLLGEVQPRTGNRSVNNAPRNVYRSSDGRWLAVSTSSQSIAERVLALVGRPDVIERPWFKTGRGRAEHADELDSIVGTWIATRTARDVTEAFEKAQAAVAPIYDVRDIVADPQYAAIGTIAEVDDPELGRIRMQDQLFRMSETPGRIRWPARPHGHDTADVLAAVGVDAARLAELKARAVV